MKVEFLIHPDLGDQRRTQVDADPCELLSDVLDRTRFLLTLWLGNHLNGRRLAVQTEGGSSLDPTDIRVNEIMGSDTKEVSLYVNVEDAIPTNPLDQASQVNVPDILGVYPESACSEATFDLMPTEEDIQQYEQQKLAAQQRTREIQQQKGVNVSYKKMLHDEAVDDYDEDDDTYVCMQHPDVYVPPHCNEYEDEYWEEGTEYADKYNSGEADGNEFPVQT